MMSRTNILERIKDRNPDTWGNYIQYLCPTCGVKPGEKCLTSNKKITLSARPHIPRVDLAIRKYEVSQWSLHWPA